jgi:hypothetical protein
MIHEFPSIESLNPQFTEQDASVSKFVNVDVKAKVINFLPDSMTPAGRA